MSLAEQQAALARVLTDKAQRERLASTYTTQDEGARSTIDDNAQIGAIDVAQIELQAHALIRKRLGCARHLLPRSLTVLGPKFADWFTEFAETNPLHGPQRYEADARRFAAFVRERLDVLQRAAFKRDIIDIDLRHGRKWLLFGVFPNKFDTRTREHAAHKTPRRFFIWLRIPWRTTYIVLRFPWTELKTRQLPNIESTA